MNKFKYFIFTFALSICLLQSPTLEVHATSGALTQEATDTPTEGESGGGGNTGHEAEENGLIYGTGDAIADIMQNSRFEGAIESIAAITEFTDTWFTRIITFVAFFIISVSMLRNAFAGAYCANPKFWDKVHEAHEAAAAVSLQQLGQNIKGITGQNVGSISKAVLTFIPDIKAWTDFEGDTIEPKAYFMKAIPQMIACIAIGIFIYNGYYRDTAATVGSMGSVLIDRTLSSVNPETFVNKLFNTTGWPKFATEGDTSLQGQTEFAICNELKSLVASNFSDVDSTQEKAQFVAATSSFVRNATQAEFERFYNVTDEKYSYKVSAMSSFATAKGVYDDGNSASTVILGDEDNNGNVPFRFIINNPVSTLALATTKGHDGNSCFVVTGTFKYVSESNGKGKSGVATDGWNGEDQVKISFTADNSVTAMSGECSVASGVAYFKNYSFNIGSLVQATDGSTLDYNRFNIEQQTHTSIKLSKGVVTITDAQLPINNDATVTLGRLKYGSTIIEGSFKIKPTAQ